MASIGASPGDAAVASVSNLMSSTTWESLAAWAVSTLPTGPRISHRKKSQMLVPTVSGAGCWPLSQSLIEDLHRASVFCCTMALVQQTRPCRGRVRGTEIGPSEEGGGGE